MGKYVFLDTELCLVDTLSRKTEYNSKTEIIQISAVLLNENFDIGDEFKLLVKPEYGTIDSHIWALTGISLEDIKYAPVLTDAMKSFVDWLPEEAVIISKDEYDRIQFQKEMICKKIELPEFNKYYKTWQERNDVINFLEGRYKNEFC